MNKKIQVLKNKFFKIVLIILALFLTWILITGILEYNKVTYDYNPIYLVIGIFIYIKLIQFVYKKVLDKLIKYKYLPYILFIVFLILAITLGIILRVNPSWDMGSVFDIAKEYVENGTVTNTEYLAKFPNNIMMICIDVIILGILRIFHIADYITGITICTAIVITLSVIFTYYIAKKILGDKKALMFLIIALFTTPLYLYVAEYYTDTFSMLVVVLLFYLWLIIKEQKNKNKKIILQILYGIILFVGYELKITSIFIYIAIIMYEICNTNVKAMLRNNGIILITAIILITSFKFIIINKLVSEENKNRYQIPLEHWIMMGMNGKGSFSYEEYEFTNKYNTLEERQKACREVIIQRLKERSMNEHIKNITTKLGWAWHDGVYFVPEVVKKQPVKRSVLLEFIQYSGKYSFLYKYIPQVMHFGMLIFIIINLKRIIENRDFKSKEVVGMISILGIMMFLIIWENRSRYLVNFLPIMILMQINGIDYFTNMKEILPYKKNTKVRRRK